MSVPVQNGGPLAARLVHPVQAKIEALVAAQPALLAAPAAPADPATYDEQVLRLVSPATLAAKDELFTPGIDVWAPDEDGLCERLLLLFALWGLPSKFGIPPAVLEGFIRAIRFSYRPNPFHNLRHAFCVTQMMFSLVHGLEKLVLTDLEKLALLVACIGHDVDHPGLTNAFQIVTSSPLALYYNDASPLESHHCALLFHILTLPGCAVLGGLSREDYAKARAIIISCIMATDISKHAAIMKTFEDALPAWDYERPADRALLFQMIVKGADISNEVRPLAQSERWAELLLEEFFEQARQEALAGVPVSPFMDPAKVSKKGAQIGFIGNVLLPLFEALGRLEPALVARYVTPVRESLAYYKGLP